jgi:choline dehydrogenase-like flavoprotein
MKILDLPEKGFAANNPDLPGGLFLADRHAQSAPTRFGEKYLAALKTSAKIDVHLNCNLVDIVFDAKLSAIQHIVVADYAGQRATLKAGRFILATGAIENARLLNSASLQSAGLPAMQWVGRGLMEHLNVELGTFMPAEGLRASDLQYFTSESIVAREGIGRGNIAFGLLSEVVSYGRTAAIKNFMKNLACDLGVADKLQFISNFHCPGAGTIGTLLEQFPTAQGSRVELANANDALGMRKARVIWTLSAEDKKTIRRVALAMAQNFAAAGLGFVKLHPSMTDDSKDIPVSPHAHHMGTTRMAKTAEWGAVDANCRMFGVSNLYVAGSSVFPTGGGGNPTMPLIQLALRLADHLVKTKNVGAFLKTE